MPTCDTALISRITHDTLLKKIQIQRISENQKVGMLFGPRVAMKCFS